MKLSRAQRQKLTRMPGQIVNEGMRRARVILKKDQTHSVGDFVLTFPPEHDLPYFQRRDATYDVYAISVLGEYSKGAYATVVIDVGGNVGDTAAAVLSASPTIRVISIEGSPRFAQYWERNATQFGGRAELVTGFVSMSDHASMDYHQERGSGGFQVKADSAGLVVDEWVDLAKVFDRAEPGEQVIFKSDIDGFDIHVLAKQWDVINGRSDLIWCEFDPVRTLGDRADVEQFIACVSDSGRPMKVYDNLGRLMLEMDPGPHIGSSLRSLTRWLTEVHRGYLTVPYLDLWLGPVGAQTAKESL